MAHKSSRKHQRDNLSSKSIANTSRFTPPSVLPDVAHDASIVRINGVAFRASDIRRAKIRLQEIQDDRRFTMSRRRPLDIAGRPVGYVVKRSQLGPRVTTKRFNPNLGIHGDDIYLRDNGYLPWKVAFRRPELVVVCMRRRIRREVLAALKPSLFRRGGRGAGKKRRMTRYSGISC